MKTHPAPKLLALGGALAGTAVLAQRRRSQTDATDGPADRPAMPLPLGGEELVIEEVEIVVTAPDQ